MFLFMFELQLNRLFIQDQLMSYFVMYSELFLVTLCYCTETIFEIDSSSLLLKFGAFLTSAGGKKHQFVNQIRIISSSLFYESHSIKIMLTKYLLCFIKERQYELILYQTLRRNATHHIKWRNYRLVIPMTRNW